MIGEKRDDEGGGREDKGVFLNENFTIPNILTTSNNASA